MTAYGDALRAASRTFATQTVRHRAATGVNEYGERVAGTAAWTTCAAQVRRPTRAERSLEADPQALEWVVVIFDPDVSIGPGDELELPGGHVRPIRSVESVRTPEADEQWALKLGITRSA